MADISLVCVRDDAWKGDLLSAALERYGFTVCRSASVYEDFSAYTAVVVLLSPGAARSELVMGTAGRALDWGKLIPVFVNLCHLPDQLAGVALHDLSAWDGFGEDPVVQAIAYHAQRLSGLPGRPSFSPDMSPRRLEAASGQSWVQPPQIWNEQPTHQPRYDLEANYARGYGHQPPRLGYAPAYISASHNELNAQPLEHNFRPLDMQAGGNSDAARRRAYFMDNQRSSFVASAPSSYAYEDERDTGPRNRPLPPFFTVVLCAMALMGTAWFEEARTRELPRAIPAQATAELSAPATVDTAEAPRHRIADRR